MFRIRIHFIRIWIQHYISFYQKLQFTFSWAFIKDVKATEEAFSPQKRTSSTYKHEIYLFFSVFEGHFCPPGSGCGFWIWIRIHWPDWIRIRNIVRKEKFNLMSMLFRNWNFLPLRFISSRAREQRDDTVCWINSSPLLKVLKNMMKYKKRRDESDERDEPIVSEDELDHEVGRSEFLAQCCWSGSAVFWEPGSASASKR